MFRSIRVLLACLTLALGMLIAVRGAEAQPQISSELLLPYFEVELSPSGVTTMFAVGNALDEPVDIVLTLHSNWGIPVDKASLKLAPREVRTFNLRDWLSGSAPGRKLDNKQVAHLKAALGGQRSPQDSMFYATAVRNGLAVGYVRIKTTRPVALWGDYLIVEPKEKSTQGEALVAIGQGASCPGLCARHILRYLLSGAFDAGTEVIVWTEKAGKPSRQPSADPVRLTADSDVYSEAGVLVDGFQLRTLPVQQIALSELSIKQPFGWLDLRTEMDSFVAVRYRSRSQGSALLRTWCLPLPPPPNDDPGIEIRKLTNGQDANVPPGPSIPVGSTVVWEYVVRNTGDVALIDIEVEDDQGVAVKCPKTSLNKGESMTCTGRGTAIACQYVNVGTVTGRTSDGVLVSDDDPSHYFGESAASIDLEKLTNGEDADVAPGPTINKGADVTWTYIVKNTGEVALSGIRVDDDREGKVNCPKSSLRPAESMTCSLKGKAGEGQYRNVGTVSGETSCGKVVRDEDASHYHNLPDNTVTVVAIDIEKHTNGQDADEPKGPEIEVGKPVLWEYFVKNTGKAALSNVKVTDDQGVAVSCPKTSLAVGESMRCTGNGTAVAGQYKNTGTATGRGPVPENKEVTDSDPSHYYGVTPPPPPPPAAIDIEKHTNGHDADTPKGPEILVGQPVLWEYIVTNTGQAALTNVNVTDDRGVAVSCPKTSLAVGESMTCTGHGTATAGQYANIGTVTGKDPQSKTVTDSDPSHYYGVVPPPDGNQGCTPGYWKNHEKSWPASGWSTSQQVQSAFGESSLYPSFGSAALIEALSFQGGPGVEGAVGNLLRAATASLLNSAHPGVDFPRTTAQVVGDVNAALASGNRDQMLGLASALDQDNNLGCPLN